MQQEVYIRASNIITSLGFNTAQNVENMFAGESGIQLCDDPLISDEPVYTSRVDTKLLNQYFLNTDPEGFYTRAEKMAITCLFRALEYANLSIDKNQRNLFLFSTTKGNIDILENAYPKKISPERIQLWKTARIVHDFFDFNADIQVVSNACISGLLAVIIGSRLIRQGTYDNVIISGVDIISRFVISGFQSFKAIDNKPCRPFDKDRNGITLGEGSAALILSNKKSLHPLYQGRVLNGASSNDANHISGPSRTGKGLALTINKALNGFPPDKVSIVNAHGTGTVYNDEMEAKALHMAGLGKTLVHSLKGYIGHTLGAAGLIEIIVAFDALNQQMIPKSLGYNNNGVSKPLHVLKKNSQRKTTNFLKTASGFGGCNASALFVNDK